MKSLLQPSVLDKNNTCCITGHRILLPKKIVKIEKCLNKEIDNLIHKGVSVFISSGAIGFSHIASSIIITKRQQGANIRLIFALPCRNQGDNWSDNHRLIFRSLLNEANEIRYISEVYTPECMTKRSHYMLDNSAYCICYMRCKARKTSRLLGYAQQQSVQIINVAK